MAVRGDVVIFRSPGSQSTISLYLSACRAVNDVEMAIKAERDQAHLDLWERTGAAAR